MKVTIYRKTRTTKPTDGSRSKQFYVYVTKLKKKNGETINATVKPTGNLKTEMDNRAEYPVVATFDKKDANLQTQIVTNKDGDFIDTFTLWLKKVADFEEFYDTSLDDFE